MTLRSRLVFGLVASAIILVAPMLYAIRSLQQLHAEAEKLRDSDVAALLQLGRLRDALNELRRVEFALLFVTKDAAPLARDGMVKAIDSVRTLTDSLPRFGLDQYARAISTSIGQIAGAGPIEYRAALGGDTLTADSLSQKIMAPAMNRADSAVRIAERDVQGRTSRRVLDENAYITRTASVSAGALLLALAIAAAVAIWLTRSISAPILELKAGMRAVADGDLDYRLKIASERTDELAQLADSFRTMTNQLAELDKLKAEFVSAASHELKTPINVMIGYLQLLEEGVYGPVDPRQAHVHKTLVVQANTLLRLVKQLLDVSRFEAGGGRLEPREVELDALLAELDSAFRVLAIQREIDFRVERHDGLPDEVFWDVDRVNEVLGNLLSNAFKFTPHGGQVSLDLRAADDGVVMKVRDTGAGIPPEQLPRIFDKFYQADNQGSARSAGSGLGLAIAKQIVEAHGGSISCQSTLGAGTTFTIMLPTRAAGRRAPVVREPAEASV